MGMTPLPGNSETIDKIDRMAARAADMAPAMEAVLESYHHFQQEQFANGGGNWAPLADSTILRKTYSDGAFGGGGDPGILIRSQEMMYSFIGGGDETTAIGPDFMDVMSNVLYAGWHQGGDEPRMPQRKLVPSPLEDSPLALLWIAILQGYLDTGAAIAASDGEIASVL
jgi:hypothetical protein